MQIEQQYSHKGGHEFISKRHPGELQEVISAIEACDAVVCLAKISQESTKQSLLFSPVMFNDSIPQYLHRHGWAEASPKSKKRLQGATNHIRRATVQGDGWHQE